jgi:single-stranded-DNA-specific exonuclease
VRASDIGFKIGPRINAAGRLASADTAIELFAAKDDETAWGLSGELDRMNSERQGVERQVRAAAEEQLRGGERVVIVAGEGWHRGVLGLTAGRLAQKLHRPALALAIDDGQCVGSARSIPTVNLHAELDKVSDLFTHFGGPEFACGFSLPAGNLDELRERLGAAFAAMDDDTFRKRARVDGELTLGEIDGEFLAAHEMLEPFGAGNPQPLFVARGVELAGTRSFATECCEATLSQNGTKMKAVIWPGVKQLAGTLAESARSDVLFTIEPDAWSASGARLVLVDAAPSGSEKLYA